MVINSFKLRMTWSACSAAPGMTAPPPHTAQTTPAHRRPQGSHTLLQFVIARAPLSGFYGHPFDLAPQCGKRGPVGQTDEPNKAARQLGRTDRCKKTGQADTRQATHQQFAEPAGGVLIRPLEQNPGLPFEASKNVRQAP